MIKSKLIIIAAFMFNLGYADCLAYKPVFELMAKRAMLLKDVAANKYKNKQGVYNPEQELRVLKAAIIQAKKRHLDTTKVMEYSQIQMDMSKQIEAYWVELWQNNPKTFPTKYQRLGVVRRQIKAIDEEIYSKIQLSVSITCSANEAQVVFNDSFNEVSGIPEDPDFRQIMLSTVLAIKHE